MTATGMSAGSCAPVSTTAPALPPNGAAAVSEAELRTVTDALPVLISFVDRDLIFRFANRYYVNWFGLTPQQVVGRHARDVIGEANFAEREALMRRALAGETIETDSILRDSQGVPRRANVRYLPGPRRMAASPASTCWSSTSRSGCGTRRNLVASNGRFRAAMDAVHGCSGPTAPMAG